MMLGSMVTESARRLSSTEAPPPLFSRGTALPCPALELGRGVPFGVVVGSVDAGDPNTVVARLCWCGANVLLARSGTACRAPTFDVGGASLIFITGDSATSWAISRYCLVRD